MSTQGLLLVKVLQGKNAFIDGVTWAVLDKRYWTQQDGWYLCKVVRVTDKDLKVLKPLSNILEIKDVQILLGIRHRSFDDLKVALMDKTLISDNTLNDDRFVALKDLAFNTHINVYNVKDQGTLKFIEKLEKKIESKIIKKYVKEKF